MDIMTGAALLGAGGGGDLGEGMGLIDMAIAAGKSFHLVSPEEAPEEVLACTPYLLGAISDLPPEQEAAYDGLPRAETHPLLLAYDRLAQHMGQAFYATVACEMGGANTAVPFFVAAMRGGVVLDGDPAGRAVPEITHSTYYLNGLPVGAIACANEFGETFLLEQVKDDARAETLVRALAQVSRNDISAVDHALPIKTLREALIPGTLEKARKFGVLLRQISADPSGAAERLAQEGSGKVVFQGEVAQATWETRGGFTFGQIHLENGANHYDIDVKNENMVGRLNGAIHATIPDLICLIDEATGQPVNNPHVQIGERLSVLILPAPAPFLTPKGLDTFGPAYCGLDQRFQSPLAQVPFLER